MGVLAIIEALVGLAMIVGGVRVLVRGEIPTVKFTGRIWRSAFEAAMFWFLLGFAVLAGPFVWAGSTADWLGPDAGFGVLLISVLVAVPAVTRFRPRVAPAVRSR